MYKNCRPATTVAVHQTHILISYVRAVGTLRLHRTYSRPAQPRTRLVVGSCANVRFLDRVVVHDQGLGSALPLRKHELPG
jgi:hypothetical protein